MAFFWAEDPCALSVAALPQSTAALALPPGAAGAMLSEPQALSASVAVKAMPAA
jgi:hypothetical protein